jgi:FkbM family methyltransferase
MTSADFRVSPDVRERGRAANGFMRLGRASRLLQVSAPFLWFCENEVAAVHRLIRPGAVCLDVGAAYGLYTWLLADLAGPTGHVHAFEPQPGLAAFLRISRWALRASNVTVHQLGIDDTPGLGWLARPSRGLLPVPGRAFLGREAGGLGSNREFGRHHAIVTPLTSLDAFVADQSPARLDFVKADIEGAEGRLLSGATHTLRTLRPILLLELENRHLARFNTDIGAIRGRLSELGYVARYFTGSTWSTRPQPIQRNVLFLPHECVTPNVVSRQ